VDPAGELYAVGGAVRNLARIIRQRRGYPLRRLHGLELSRREVHRVAAGLVSSSPSARRRIPGVSPSRADILPAAAVVIDEVMDVAGASSLRVSGQGLREGLAWQLLRGPEPLPDVRATSLESLARVNGVDPAVAAARARTALALFEATRPAHRLTDFDRGLLAAAASVADIGLDVDYYNRERHAEYLVHSSDLHGFNHREIALLGALVRCASSGTPDLLPYRDLLQPGDVEAAATLSALLGVATALHRRGAPAETALALDEGTLTITLAPGQHAEALAVSRQLKRAEAALGLRLVMNELP
jgi:exopolyphosphatase/guanosine-5'-triphosphate,3'-diphosphate pyrophosphatase